MRTPALVLFALVVAASAAALTPAPPQVIRNLKIHEGGVFLVNGKGTVPSDESPDPAFIQRVKVPPRPLRQGATDEKMVEGGPQVKFRGYVFVDAPETLTCLDVRIFSPSGRPELAWPCAAWVGWQQDGYGPVGLSWILSLPKKKEKEGKTEPPKIPEDHWISAVRKVGSDLLTQAFQNDDGYPARSRDAERFLFYEGILARTGLARNVEFEPGNPLRFRLLGMDAENVWVVRGAEKAGDLRASLLQGLPPEILLAPGPVQVVEGILEPIQAGNLREGLAKELTGAGLSEAEAGALLAIWMPGILKPGKRLVHVLPREVYDRLLPIYIYDSPEELKRVGLVIQEVAP